MENMMLSNLDKENTLIDTKFIFSNRNNNNNSNEEEDKNKEINIDNSFLDILLENSSCSPPTKRISQVMVYFSNCLWIYGGKSEISNLNDICVYSLKQKSWKCLPTIKGCSPGQRRAPNAVIYNNKLYIYGGLAGSKWFNDLFSFSYEKWEWESIPYQSVPPPATYLSSLVVYQNSMYLFGGETEEIQKYPIFWKYHFESKKWTELKTKVISQRYGHSAVIYDDSMYIFGGKSSNGIFFNDLFQYSFKLNDWIRAINIPGNSPPCPRFAHSVSLIGKCMYIFGGISKENNIESSFFQYNFRTKTWESINSNSSKKNPLRRAFASMTTNKKNLFLFGGNSTKGYKNSIYKYYVKHNSWKKMPNIIIKKEELDITYDQLSPNNEGCTNCKEFINKLLKQIEFQQKEIEQLKISLENTKLELLTLKQKK